jgi:hypothetical protein
MKNTFDDITEVLKCLAIKIKGRGTVLSEKETTIRAELGKARGEVYIFLDRGILRSIKDKIDEESKKLFTEIDGGHHLIRYIALCGRIKFDKKKIKEPNNEIFYALGYVFQQTLRCIKRGRVEEEKGAIHIQADKIVSNLPSPKRVTSVYYMKGVYGVKISGRSLIFGRDAREVIFNLNNFLGLKSSEDSQ